MKKLFCLFLIFALLAACSGGCQKDISAQLQQPPDQSPAPAESEPEPETDWDADIVPFDPAGFTQAQMLEDYDYFWDTILENCPLMAAYPRQMGQTVEEARLQYR